MEDRHPNRPLPPSSSASSSSSSAAPPPPTCDSCSDNIAFLYCKADSARLCLLCDYQVHTANSLSLKHSRFPLCETCGSHPASLKQQDEGGVEEEGEEGNKSFFICHSCHEEEEEEKEEGKERNKATEPFHNHKRKVKKITPLTGCLTPAEISKCWKWKVDDANSLLKDDTYLFKKSLLSLPDIWSNLDGCGISFPSSCWGNNSDSFLVPELNELSFRGTSAHHLTCPQKRAFKEQLERLLKQQYVAEADSPGLHYDSGYSTEQFVMAEIHNDLDTEQKCQLSSQQDVGYVHTLMSKLEEIGTCPNKCVWYGNSVKIPETEVSTSHHDADTPLATNETGRSLIFDNATDFLHHPSHMSNDQNITPHTPHLKKAENSKSSNIAKNARSSKFAKELASEITKSYHYDHMSMTSSMQSYPDVQQSEQLPSPKSGGSGCPGAPPSPTAEEIAQARGNAMTRYKEKKRTRKYEKVIRYESRKARADIRQRVRGRFVKANRLNKELIVYDDIG